MEPSGCIATSVSRALELEEQINGEYEVIPAGRALREC